MHLSLQKLNVKAANTFINYLKLYPIDHHSRAIKDLLGELIDRNLPELQDYLESRLLKTN